jgi:hypothetical protein
MRLIKKRAIKTLHFHSTRTQLPFNHSVNFPERSLISTVPNDPLRTGCLDDLAQNFKRVARPKNQLSPKGSQIRIKACKCVV